jgi:hypothetical protein
LTTLAAASRGIDQQQLLEFARHTTPSITALNDYLFILEENLGVAMDKVGLVAYRVIG